jgi:hypothetical protein
VHNYSRISTSLSFLFEYYFEFFVADLSSDQILNLRRREALAYESDVFEQATKEKQSDVNRQEKLDVQLRHLRKMVSHVKITCEASTTDD